LPETERQTVTAHLETCAVCQAELAELQQLFLALEAVPDLPPTTDLSAAIEAEITHQKAVDSEQFTVNSWPLLILEIIAAGVLLFLLWPTVQEWLLPAFSWQAQFTANMAWPTNISWPDVGGWITAVSRQIQPASFIELPAAQWAALIGAALIIWLAGSRLLFTNNPFPTNGDSHG
jgi:hypothetical protein